MELRLENHEQNKENMTRGVGGGKKVSRIILIFERHPYITLKRKCRPHKRFHKPVNNLNCHSFKTVIFNIEISRMFEWP